MVVGVCVGGRGRRWVGVEVEVGVGVGMGVVVVCGCGCGWCGAVEWSVWVGRERRAEVGGWVGWSGREEEEGGEDEGGGGGGGGGGDGAHACLSRRAL